MQKQPKKKIIIGLTGSFGSGKSTVAGIFNSFGAKVVDADLLARQCVTPGKLAYKKIVKSFGREILSKDKTIDRAKLGRIVFWDTRKLKRLNDIVHPEVIRHMKMQIKSTEQAAVVLDVPLLIEAGLRSLVDKVVVVKINRAEQIKRCQQRTMLSESDIVKRIKAQMSLSAKERLADFVIDNSGTVAQTRKQVEEILRSLVSDKRIARGKGLTHPAIKKRAR